MKREEDSFELFVLEIHLQVPVTHVMSQDMSGVSQAENLENLDSVVQNERRYTHTHTHTRLTLFVARAVNSSQSAVDCTALSWLTRHWHW